MIDQVMQFLAAGINAHLTSYLGRDTEPYTALSALATPEGMPQQGIEQRVILTMVNLERETAGVVAAPARIRPTTNGLVSGPPLLQLNIYVLMSAHHQRYAEALKRLSLAVAFVHAHPAFDPASSPDFPEGVDRLSLELVALDFMALNNLWASTGSKYLPSVVFKVRMSAISPRDVSQRIPRVGGVDSDVDAAPPGERP
jgi:hypothetical protein